MEKSVEYLAVETLRGPVPEDHVVLCYKAVFPVIPLGLDIEVAGQIRETPVFHKEREKLACFLLEARCRRNVDELEARKLPEQRPVGTQVRDVSVEVSVLGINVGKSRHRHVIGSGIGYAERKCLGERDGLAMLIGQRKQALAEFEPFDEVASLLFRRLEIAVFRAGKDEIESQKPRLDVIEFVLPAIAEMGLANHLIKLPGTQVIDEASPGVSSGRGMTQTNSFSTKRAFRLPLLAWAKSRNWRTVK